MRTPPSRPVARLGGGSDGHSIKPPADGLQLESLVTGRKRDFFIGKPRRQAPAPRRASSSAMKKPLAMTRQAVIVAAVF
jgi:hypothetical protein